MLGQQSRWKAYFDILPNHFDTLMFWSEEELEYLQSSAVVDKIGRSAADELFDNVLIPIIRRHETVFKTAVEMSDQQLKDLAHRMGSIIMSYAFDIEKEDDEDEADEDGYATDDEEQVSRGMVPLADLLNADAEPNVRLAIVLTRSKFLTFRQASLFQSTDILTMKSLKPIPARTEVLNDYGQLPRSDLLRRYGYITPSYAKFDCVEVSRRLLNKHMTRDRENINRENRLIYLLEKEILEDNYDIVWPENSENMDFFPDDLSRYVKAMLTSEDKYKNVAKTGASDDSLLLLFKTTMKLVVHARMSEYPTSIAQDLKTLADQDLDIRQKMAIEVRLGEKNLLEAASARLSEDDQPQNNGRAQSNGEPASKKRRT